MGILYWAAENRTMEVGLRQEGHRQTQKGTESGLSMRFGGVNFLFWNPPQPRMQAEESNWLRAGLLKTQLCQELASS